MKIRQTNLAVAALAGLSMLAACSKDGATETAPATEAAPAAEEVVLDTGRTAKEQVEFRQGQFKKMGKAFKTISDELKSSNPDVTVIQAAAASVPEITADMDTWFPAGSGPGSGVKTDALPVIWENPDDFAEKIANLGAAADGLAAAAEGVDIAAIGTAFGTTGGTCKSCHDTYRADD